MADEIGITLTVRYNETTQGIDTRETVCNDTFDQTTKRYVESIQNIGTAAENLEVGDVASLGYIIGRNLDTTNYVELGHDDTGFVPLLKVPPAAPFIWYPPSTVTVPQGKSNTAACNVKFRVFAQ